MLIHFCMRSPDKAVKKNDHFNGTLQNAHIFKWTPVFTAKKRQLNEWGVGGGGGWGVEGGGVYLTGYNNILFSLIAV